MRPFSNDSNTRNQKVSSGYETTLAVDDISLLSKDIMTMSKIKDPMTPKANTGAGLHIEN